MILFLLNIVTQVSFVPVLYYNIHYVNLQMSALVFENCSQNKHVLKLKFFKWKQVYGVLFFGAWAFCYRCRYPFTLHLFFFGVLLGWYGVFFFGGVYVGCVCLKCSLMCRLRCRICKC